MSIQNNSTIHISNGQTFVGIGNGVLSGTRIGDILYLSPATSNLPIPTLNALAVDAQTISLNWENQVPGTTSIAIERQLNGASGFSTVVTLSALASDYMDTTSLTVPRRFTA